MAGRQEQAIKAMEKALGAQHVVTDEDTLTKYSLNMLSVDNVVPATVVRPGSVEEILGNGP